MRLLQVVHDVQLADTLEIAVEGLHDDVDELEVRHLVLFALVHSDDEVEGGIPPVYYFPFLVHQKLRLVFVASQTLADQFPL